MSAQLYRPPPRGRRFLSAILLVALSTACGEIARDEPDDDGSETDAAPGEPDGSGPGPDAPVADEHGVFDWQQHYFSSFPQVVVDRSGGAAVAATFTGKIDVGGGDLTAGDLANLALARHDGDGAHLTSVAYGADGEEFVIQSAIGLDDNQIVAGLFRGTATVGGATFGPATGFNSYVARYEPAGTHVWSVPITSLGTAFVRGVSINGSGQPAVAGNFEPSVIVDGQERISAGGNDIFYLRLNQAGGIATFVRFGGIGNDLGLAALYDGLGRVYLVGVTDGAIDFGGGVAVETAGGRDLFVVQMSEQGAPMWAITAGGPDDTADLVYAAVAPNGDLLVSGSFTGTMTFPGVDPLESLGNGDIYLARISPAAGEVRWANRFGGPGNDSSRGVAVGPGGAIGLTGEFAGTASFGGPDHDSRGFLDAFVALYQPGGELVFSRTAGSGGDDRGLSVAVDEGGALLVSLAFHDRIDLGGTPLDATGDDFNGAVVKYGP
jgi:hypothetical protein